VWQTNLAKEYSIYGFNYYHYWVKGKKLLEKPAENLLRWKDIKHKFMFMWANHDWTRSWVGEKEILIKQKYGEEKDWIEHINYLIPFFKDSRYITIENKPVFEIYIRRNIYCFDEMMEVWNNECIKNGFPGIYIIDHQEYTDYLSNNNSKYCNAITYEQHSCALRHREYSRNIFQKLYFLLKHKYCKDKNSDKLLMYEYSEIIKYAIRFMKNIENFNKVIFQVSTGWDNTPRYGKKGYIIQNATPDLFRLFLSEAKKFSEKLGSEYIFLACWNEWCEGLILEPSNKNGYAYLEAIKDVLAE